MTDPNNNIKNVDIVNNNTIDNDTINNSHNNDISKVKYGRGEHPNCRAVQFKTSGNPRGRPKMTEAQKDALEGIRKLAPTAVKTLSDILNDKHARGADRLKAAELIIERTYGKATATVNVNTSGADIASDIKAELQSIKNQFAVEIAQADLENRPEILAEKGNKNG